MGTWLPIIISLISGGVGGNIAGALMKKFDLGPISGIPSPASLAAELAVSFWAC